RKRPCHLQLADIGGRDLLELRVALVGIISCRHHPIFWVLRHSDQLIVGMSSARSEDRYGAHASVEQEIAHRYPPCDSTAGDPPKSTPRGPRRPPFHKTSFPPRGPPQRGASARHLSYLRPATLTRIRQNSR